MKKGFSLLLTVLVTVMCLTLVACDGSTFDDDSGNDNGDGDGNDNGDGDGVSESVKEGITSLSSLAETLRGDVYGFEIKTYENGKGVGVLKFYRNGEDFNVSNVSELGGLIVNVRLIVLDGVIYILNDEKEVYAVYDADKDEYERITNGLTTIVNMVDILDEMVVTMEIRDTGEGSFIENTYYYEEYPLSYEDDEDLPDYYIPPNPMPTYVRFYYDDDGNFVGWCNEQGLGTAYEFTSKPDMSNFKLPSNYAEVDINSGEIDIENCLGNLVGIYDFENNYGVDDEFDFDDYDNGD